MHDEGRSGRTRMQSEEIVSEVNQRLQSDLNSRLEFPDLDLQYCSRKPRIPYTAAKAKTQSFRCEF